ncbi:DUF3732 domain-containing protein [Halioxenophilus aromaticivorans]|uniref:Uncharacterized protein n=1 Tax=Halioxenophilus aromaticivorans TaxID=1306992 RepID=A0AAV3U8D9_9ALTE
MANNALAIRITFPSVGVISFSFKRVGLPASLGKQVTAEADADIQAVQRLFELLYKFTQDETPGFQLIVTEHANLPEQWFQDALVEQPWSKPPALVPEDWP